MRHIRTLLVEDDEHIRRLLATIIQGWGVEVLEFSDASSLVCSRTVCPCDARNACGDILMTDQMMPGMTGLELITMHSQKRCPMPRGNRAIITAASDLWEIHPKASDLDCRVFRKPLELDVLRKWILECQERISPIRELLLPDDIRAG